MSDITNDVLWRRLRYMLTPQWDIYHSLGGLVEGQRVLEIGFGTGTGMLQLAARAESVTGVELNTQAVQFAQLVYPLRNGRWLEGDVLDLPQTLRSHYDAAVMIEVLEHVSDWKRALANVRTALKPGGRLYISSRNANADLRRNDLHEREVTAAEFTQMLGQYFSPVVLYDYQLQTQLTNTTRMTPLVAVGWKGT